jgi:hypothetical protein
MSIKPTLRADPVILNTRIEAAREVSELPIVEISWAVHKKEKSRLRKTANGEIFLSSELVVICATPPQY